MGLFQPLKLPLNIKFLAQIWFIVPEVNQKYVIPLRYDQKIKKFQIWLIFPLIRLLGIGPAEGGDQRQIMALS